MLLKFLSTSFPLFPLEPKKGISSSSSASRLCLSSSPRFLWTCSPIPPELSNSLKQDFLSTKLFKTVFTYACH